MGRTLLLSWITVNKIVRYNSIAAEWTTGGYAVLRLNHAVQIRSWPNK